MKRCRKLSNIQTLAAIVFTLFAGSFPISALATAGISQQKGLRAFGNPSASADLNNSETRLLYGQLKEIRYFGIIAASVVGDSEQIGITEPEITKYITSQFREDFGGSLYEDISKDSREFLSLLSSRDRNVGNITCRVWVVIDSEVVIYHIKCDAGNFENPSIWSEEVLGHGTKASSPDAIRNILHEMMKEFASVFFRVRGHQM